MGVGSMEEKERGDDVNVQIGGARIKGEITELHGQNSSSLP